MVKLTVLKNRELLAKDQLSQCAFTLLHTRVHFNGHQLICLCMMGFGFCHTLPLSIAWSSRLADTRYWAI